MGPDSRAWQVEQNTQSQAFTLFFPGLIPHAWLQQVHPEKAWQVWCFLKDNIPQQEDLMEAKDLTDALLPSLASPPSRMEQLCPSAPIDYRPRVTFKSSGSQASLRKFLRFTLS